MDYLFLLMDGLSRYFYHFCLFLKLKNIHFERLSRWNVFFNLQSLLTFTKTIKKNFYVNYVFYYGLILCGFFFDLRPEIVHYDHFTRWNVYFDSLNFLNWLKFYYYEPMTGFRLNRFLVTYNWFNDYFLFFRTLHQVKRLVLLFILLKFILKILIFAISFCYI